MNNYIIMIILGFIFGLGAVTVIDTLGFLAYRSKYWTLATTRSHKITKPIIWAGIFLILLGHMLLFIHGYMSDQEFLLRFAIITTMLINGIYLSFFISPYLIKLEKSHNDSVFLNRRMKAGIFASFIASFICWWGIFYLFLVYLGLL